MERRERGRSLTEAGYTIIIPSNAAMRVASERFFQRLNAKMLDTADLRYFRRGGKGRYDDYNRREQRWCNYHAFKPQWSDGRVAKDLSKSICYLLRHEEPKKSGRDAGGWVPIENIINRMCKKVSFDFEGALGELLMWLCSLPEGNGVDTRLPCQCCRVTRGPTAKASGPCIPLLMTPGGGARQ